jgi:hypothetical protein
MWKRVSNTFIVVIAILMLAYHVSWAAGVSRADRLPVGGTLFGLAALWGVAALGRQVALQYAKPHDRHGPEADYHDPAD